MKLGFVVAVAGAVIVVAGFGGCSKSTPNTSPTPSSTTTSASASTSSTPANTSSSSTTPSSTATSTTATASASFVGQWHVQGATLDIAQRTATMVVSLGMGPCSLGAPTACSTADVRRRARL